ncbi:MAG: hypothetical protein FWC91_07370 [Defluviitaleaceae bacterium]|nr:hypothetical protein [Defluviitaleaceae bacterium]
MYLTVKQQLKNLSKEDYQNLKMLSHTAKNLCMHWIFVSLSPPGKSG